MIRTLALTLATTSLLAAAAQAAPMLSATRLFVAPTGSAAEIPAYDKRNNRLFVSSPSAITYYDATTGAALGSVNVASVFAGSPNSIAIQGNLLAVAMEAATKTDPGRVLVYRLDDLGAAPRVFTVGAQPDMITFAPGGRILTANEGEPNSYGLPTSVDPEGSVSIIDLKSGTVATADFSAFNGSKAALQAAGVRLNAPGATVAQDLEPEYIAISKDGTRAMVTLQEANAVAIIDIASASVIDIKSGGYKSFAVGGPFTIDPNDQDGGYFRRQRDNTYAVYQADGIARFTIDGIDYYITADEGDARDWDNIGGLGINSELVRAGAAFAPFNRLEVIRPSLYGAAVPAGAELITIGGRGFRILDASGSMLYESGDRIEDIVAGEFPGNRNNGRDDNKGAEPEDVKIGHINGRTIAFIGLERANGTTPGLVLAFDLTGYVPGMVPTYLGGISDDAIGRPEGLVFWRNGGRAFLGVADEITFNLAVFEIGLLGVPAPSAVALFGLGLLGLAAARRRRA